MYICLITNSNLNRHRRCLFPEKFHFYYVHKCRYFNNTSIKYKYDIHIIIYLSICLSIYIYIYIYITIHQSIKCPVYLENFLKSCIMSFLLMLVFPSTRSTAINPFMSLDNRVRIK